MTSNIFNKKVWSKEDWTVYFNNLNVLCKIHELKKKEFNQIVGKWNVFRKDLGKPGRDAVLSICYKFSVTERWLSTPHNIEDFNTSEIYELKKDFDLHGGYTSHTLYELTGDDKMSDAVTKIIKIYDSGDKKMIKLINRLLSEFCAALTEDE